MKAIAEFTRTTLIGGVLVVLPIYVTGLLLAKTLAGLLSIATPLASQIPADVQWRGALAWLILIGACFVAGIVVRTGPGLRAKHALERSVLEKVPGYTVVRSIASRFAGAQEDASFAVALVEIEEALVPAFIVEELDDGSCTVFVPSIPTPAAGAIYILPASRVHRVDVPLATGISIISKWGAGAGALVKALEAQRRSDPPA